MARGKIQHSPGTAAIFVFLAFALGFYNWANPIQKMQSHIEGALTGWSIEHVVGTVQGSVIRFRLAGYSEEFHIDPDVVHDHMRNRIPAGFKKGADIVVIADAAQLASPIHPLLHPHLGIVWVHGLMVNGTRVLSLHQVLAQRHGDSILWFVATAAALGYFVFTLWDRHKRRAST